MNSELEDPKEFVPDEAPDSSDDLEGSIDEPSTSSTREPITRWFSPTRLLILLAEYVEDISVTTLYSVTILWLSIFTYMTIYNFYVPAVAHTKPIYFRFDSNCAQANNCSTPFALINFREPRTSVPFVRGQSYRFTVLLEMPESEVNWSQGQFMIRLRLLTNKGQVLHDESRPAILNYKSLITRLIQALCYWPLHMISWRNEMQSLKVLMVDSFEGDIDRALIELVVRDIQVYSSRLLVEANLSGLAYLMYQWPITSFMFGVLSGSLFLWRLSAHTFRRNEA